MKSTNKKRKKFTLEDFEKGLMLAGHLSPINKQELKEKEALKQCDAILAKEKSKIYFKRSVLAAEIVNELMEEKTFGRIKFQKMVYLCENVIHMNLGERYQKFAAGPFDNKFMHSINKEFKKQKWFDVEIVREGKYPVPKYSRLQNNEKYKEYFQKYFSKNKEAIHSIISLFRTKKTHYVELVATLFACWKEIIDNNQTLTNDLILEKLYSWSEEKKKYKVEEVLEALDWMKDQNLTPLAI
jgi:hypothetical protein